MERESARDCERHALYSNAVRGGVRVCFMSILAKCLPAVC